MAVTRCSWPGSDPLYQHYHDTEWGVPLHDDYKLFEFLVLEGQQAGLSWLTVLKKREAFRAAFDGFDFEQVAEYGEDKIAELLDNPAIIRNRRKLQGAVTNAQCFLRVREEYGTFDDYIWGFLPGGPLQNRWRSQSEIPAVTDLSKRLSKDLKQRGFTFVGPTIVYAHMQATGMVNDHTTDCFRHEEVKRLVGN